MQKTEIGEIKDTKEIIKGNKDTESEEREQDKREGK